MEDAETAEGGGELAAEQRVEEALSPPRGEEPAGLNVGLLVFLLAILGLVAASNVWLRRRAERESATSSTGDDGEAGS